MGNISRFIHLLMEQVNWKFNLIYIEMEIIRMETFITIYHRNCIPAKLIYLEISVIACFKK